MRSDWDDYLRKLGFEEPLMERAAMVLRFYTQTVQIEPSFLFVSEYRDKERRVYDSLWLCNKETICEAKKFVNQDNFDCVALRNRVARWEARAIDFDWVSPNDGSRLNLEINFRDQIGGSLRASSDNCLTLVEMLKAYIVPNLVL